MKRKCSKDIENSRGKPMEALEIKSCFSQIKIIVETHSSRLEQVEDRISGLEDE
jgi:hypothetical protein